MSSERLETHEENLRLLLRDVETLISHTLPNVRGDELRRYLKQTERKLKDADTEYQSLQSELKKAPRQFQQEYNLTMARYNNELNSLRRQLISHSNMSARSDLLEGDQSPSFGATDSSYDQLLKSSETLNRASESVFRAQQVSAETDQIGIEIMNELGEQRQSLLRTRNRVRGFDAQMNQTRSLLRKIACQSAQTRVVLIGVIILELLVLAIVIWIRFFKSKK